ncbi:MAG: hypothetical protein KF845_08905 [Cyclobacteriaceae bacterium]|nr:hypothetical protein [Cyclobacteriaceae bacterium]
MKNSVIIKLVLIIITVISIAFGVIEYGKVKSLREEVSKYQKAIETCNNELKEQKELADKLKKEAGLSFLEARRLQKLLEEKK